MSFCEWNDFVNWKMWRYEFDSQHRHHWLLVFWWYGIISTPSFCMVCWMRLIAFLVVVRHELRYRYNEWQLPLETPSICTKTIILLLQVYHAVRYVLVHAPHTEWMKCGQKRENRIRNRRRCAVFENVCRQFDSPVIIITVSKKVHFIVNCWKFELFDCSWFLSECFFLSLSNWISEPNKRKGGRIARNSYFYSIFFFGFYKLREIVAKNFFFQKTQFPCISNRNFKIFICERIQCPVLWIWTENLNSSVKRQTISISP